MLTCEICGEDVLLEEDLKTHLLLRHMEEDLFCPLCSLSGMSYNQLCFHMSSAHPEDSSTCTEASNTGGAGATSRGAGGISCGTGEAVLFDASMVRTDLVPTRQRSTAGVRCSSQEETALIPVAITTQDTKATSVSDGCCVHPSTSVHVKGQPLLLSSSRRETLFSCPMCNLVCSSSFILQEHVELHLQDQHSDEGNPDSDLQLATRLQREEEQSRRQEEARQEREEFQKLQRQFGLDGGGGYRQQMQRTMERAVARGVLSPADFHRHKANMMECLALGLDDGATRTRGVVKALQDYYRTHAMDCVHVWLTADTDHYSSSGGDKGWGCGYRNFQMLLSSLRNIDPYSTHLQGTAVPCIPRLQTMIEEAWKEGLDPQGASHFNQQLQGTRSWIGATEIYVLLTSLGISARIMDFHKSTGPAGTHPLLFDWIRQYFSQSNGSSRLPPRLIQTGLPPLYLQHQGHSRSVVGLEQRKNGVLCLLLFDPGCPPSHSSQLLSSKTVGGAVRRLRVFLHSLKHQQYQLVAAEGVLSAEEKQVGRREVVIGLCSFGSS
ncbi:zinc finger-containing ubiquitin peptidase 1 [Xenentodon cancila]